MVDGRPKFGSSWCWPKVAKIKASSNPVEGIVSVLSGIGKCRAIQFTKKVGYEDDGAKVEVFGTLCGIVNL